MIPSRRRRRHIGWIARLLKVSFRFCGGMTTGFEPSSPIACHPDMSNIPAKGYRTIGIDPQIPWPAQSEEPANEWRSASSIKPDKRGTACRLGVAAPCNLAFLDERAVVQERSLGRGREVVASNPAVRSCGDATRTTKVALGTRVPGTSRQLVTPSHRFEKRCHPPQL